MTIQEQEKYFNKYVEEMRTTLFKKGQDYSNEDRLSNFKVTSPHPLAPFFNLKYLIINNFKMVNLVVYLH